MSSSSGSKRSRVTSSLSQTLQSVDSVAAKKARVLETQSASFSAHASLKEARRATEYQVTATPPVFKRRGSETSENSLKKALYGLRGQSVALRVGQVLDKVYSIPKEGFSRFWDEVSNADLYVKATDTSRADDLTYMFLPAILPEENVSISVIQTVAGLNNFLRQTFRGVQGIKDSPHCVLAPIGKWLHGRLELAKTDKTIDNINRLLEHYDRLMKKYEHGVPDNAMQEVADAFGIGITVNTPFISSGDENNAPTHTWIPSKIKTQPKKWFRYVNTRINHLENVHHSKLKARLISTNAPKEIVETRQRMHEVRQELLNKGTFFAMRKDKKGPTSIFSYDTHYILKRKAVEIMDRFMREHPIYDFGGDKTRLKSHLNDMELDDNKDKKVSEFVREGCHFPISKCFVPDIADMDEHQLDEFCLDMKAIDMRKAYTQWSACGEHYKGFLGRITDFRRTDRIVGVGMYRITDVSYDKVPCSMQTLVKTYIPILANMNVYPSPLLEFLQKQGITFQILEGVWGSNIHFELPEEMFEKDDDNKSIYALWAGSNTCRKSMSDLYIYAEMEYLQHLRKVGGAEKIHAVYPEMWDMVFSCSQTHNSFEPPTERNLQIDDHPASKFVEGCVTIENPAALHLTHITAFITGYMYINLFRQMAQMDLDSVAFLNSDGIFFRDHQFRLQTRHDTPNGTEYPGAGYKGPDRSTLWACSNVDGIRFRATAGHAASRTHASVDDPVSDQLMDEDVEMNGVSDYGASLSTRYPYIVSGIDLHPEKVQCTTPLPPDNSNTPAHHMISAHIGPAGTGKSYALLNDPGFVRVGYISLCWRLSRQVEEENKGHVRLVEVSECITSPNPTRRQKLLRYCNVLIVDEISMLTEFHKQNILKLLGNDIKICFCGDPGYQLLPVCTTYDDSTSTQPMTVAKLPTTLYDKNYRYGECRMLSLLAKRVRQMIEQFVKSVEAKEDKAKYRQVCTEVNEYISEFLRKHDLEVSYEKMLEDYSVRDIVVAARNVTKDKVTEDIAAVVKEKGFERKWYVTRNDWFRKVSNGDIIVSKERPKGVKCDERYCFTVHSMQGQTLHPDAKLYIDTKHMTSPQHMYTAITRARRLEQLRLTTCPAVLSLQDTEDQEHDKNRLSDGTYKQGHVYKITNHRGQYYIGHTMGTVETRLKRHWDTYSKRNSYKNNHPSSTGRSKYISSWNVLARSRKDSVKIETLSTLENVTRSDMLAEERKAINSCQGDPKCVNIMYNWNNDMASSTNKTHVDQGKCANILGTGIEDLADDAGVFVERVNCKALEKALAQDAGDEKADYTKSVLQIAQASMDEDGIGYLYVAHQKKDYSRDELIVRRFGRRYCHPALKSLQHLPKKFRHPAMSGLVLDIDVVNCHPTLLVQLYSRLVTEKMMTSYDVDEIVVEDFDPWLKDSENAIRVLQDYVDNRSIYIDNVRTSYNVSRDAAKELFIRLLYGGEVSTWITDNKLDTVENETLPPYLRELDAAFKHIQKDVLRFTDVAQLYYTTKDNVASYMSLYLQDIEDRVLMAMTNYVTVQQATRPELFGQTKCETLMWDGVSISNEDFVEKHPETGDIDAVDEQKLRAYLNGMQSYVYKHTGMSVDIESKEICV